MNTTWCVENLRNCQAWNDSGLPITTTSNEAAQLYDALLRQLVCWSDCHELGGLMATAEKLIAADPESIIGRCLVLSLDCLGVTKSVIYTRVHQMIVVLKAHNDPIFAADLNRLVKDAQKSGNNREKLHCQAIQHFAFGRLSQASKCWEEILAEHPTDLMAVKFAHDSYFFSWRFGRKFAYDGERYSFVHGMHAFALEENEKYKTAEIEARYALELNPFDPWATHAIAHCYEMTGQFKLGIEFMESTRSYWEPAWLLACHNHWHTALFHLEHADYEKVLDIYDTEIVERSKSKTMLDVVDAASLLQRLEIEKVDVGRERWKALVPLIEEQLDNHVLAFNDVHCAMILANIDDFELEQSHARSLQSYVSTTAVENENRNITEKLGIPICESIADFRRGEFADCFDRLYAARNSIREIGGSNAQRDVFTQLALSAGFQSEASGHKDMAMELLAERQRFKHGSLVGSRILQMHETGNKL
ncbi:Tetratricopeptide repeat protein 38 [Aphelenchoides besseyi]|nr:Tetratricopeptide repeat protein 38 [Aphelenchoides besseyi]